MSIELRMLGLSVILGIVQLLIATQISTAKRGLKWNMSPRDEAQPPLTGVAGRLDRALQNFKETFPFFIAVVVLVELTQTHTNLTATGAQLYFWARLLYVPIYAAGIAGVRTLVWGAATLGIVLMLVAVMF